ncbi:hypothetical protein GGR56DRAFT_638629 [Xylariaceae sp. FL0804]|nr:hypothetical protein GGR56DRAFT_638629 [Xylariaceae sp. FL0804]
MVGTRSGLRARGQELTPNRQNQAESSSEDENGIPAQLPAKRLTPSSLSLSGSRHNLKRRAEDDSLYLYSSPKNQRRSDHLPPASRTPKSPPTPSKAAQVAEHGPSPGGDTGSSDEEAVPAGLTSNINASIQRLHQDKNSSAVQQIDFAGASGQTPNGPLVATSIEEPIPLDLNEVGTVGSDGLAESHGKEDGPVTDVWEVPVSPNQDTRSSIPRQSGTPKPPTKARRGRPPKADGLKQRPPPSSGSKQVSRAQEIPEDAGPSRKPPLADVAEDPNGSDDDGQESVDLSVQESFAHDIEVFRAGNNSDNEDLDGFQGPGDDDIFHIRLEYRPLKRICQIVRRKAWIGLKSDWQWQPYRGDGATSYPAKQLILTLSKLERLYQETPKAPQLKEQNRFLREHGDMWHHYVKSIDLIIHQMCSEHLAEPSAKELRQLTKHAKLRKEEERDMMAEDVAELTIPKLVHVIASTWRLGGEESNPWITSTIEKLLQWPFQWFRQLQSLPVCGEQLKTVLGKKGKEFEGLLKEFATLLSDAPNRLIEEKSRLAQEAQDYQQSLIEQKETKARWKREEQARLADIEQRKLRSLESVRELRSATGASRHFLSPAVNARQGSSSPAAWPSSGRLHPSKAPSRWLKEEKVFLFTRIQESYPYMPDLDTLRRELNRPLADTENMARELLVMMLQKVVPDVATAKAEAQSVWQQYVQRDHLHDYEG